MWTKLPGKLSQREGQSQHCPPLSPAGRATCCPPLAAAHPGQTASTPIFRAWSQDQARSSLCLCVLLVSHPGIWNIGLKLGCTWNNIIQEVIQWKIWGVFLSIFSSPILKLYKKRDIFFLSQSSLSLKSNKWAFRSVKVNKLGLSCANLSQS